MRKANKMEWKKKENIKKDSELYTYMSIYLYLFMKQSNKAQKCIVEDPKEGS